MTSAALFLVWCTLRNRTRLLLRQLRSPRYAIALVIGVAYLTLVLLGHRQAPGVGLAPGALAAWGVPGAAGARGQVVALGADTTALAFSRPEIQFLFPAPVSRTAVLGYKLARTQALILLNVLLWTALFRRPGLAALPHAAGLWIAFSTVSLHRLGVALTRESLLHHGLSGWRRAWLPVAAVGLFATGVAVSVLRLPPGGLEPLARLESLVSTPPLRWLLLPFAVPLAPLGAETPAAFLRALAPALLFLALHLAWVLRADRRFEEAAIEASARRAEVLARLRREGASGTLRPAHARWRLRLAPTGHPTTAIIWKNLSRLLRTVNPALIGALLVLVAFVVGIGASRPDGEDAILTITGTVSLSWAAVLVLVGPQWIRVDLRGELDQLDLLRAWPLSGTEIMAGMVCSSALVLWIATGALGGLGVAALWLQGQLGASISLVAVLCVVGALVLGAITLIALGIQNGAALLYPSWVRTEIRPGGVEQMGQHLLTAGASMLLLLGFLIGPALLGLGVVSVVGERLGNWALAPAGVLAGFGLLLEAFLLLDWLGARFEQGVPDHET